MQRVRNKRDEKVVGLSRPVLQRETTTGKRGHVPPAPGASIEEEEAYARSMQLKNPFRLFWEGTYAALVVFSLYLVTLDTIVSCLACVGMTMYWYLYSVSVLVDRVFLSCGWILMTMRKLMHIDSFVYHTGRSSS